MVARLPTNGTARRRSVNFDLLFQRISPTPSSLRPNGPGREFPRYHQEPILPRELRKTRNPSPMNSFTKESKRPIGIRESRRPRNPKLPSRLETPDSTAHSAQVISFPEVSSASSSRGREVCLPTSTPPSALTHRASWTSSFPRVWPTMRHRRLSAAFWTLLA